MAVFVLYGYIAGTSAVLREHPQFSLWVWGLRPFEPLVLTFSLRFLSPYNMSERLGKVFNRNSACISKGRFCFHRCGSTYGIRDTGFYRVCFCRSVIFSLKNIGTAGKVRQSCCPWRSGSMLCSCKLLRLAYSLSSILSFGYVPPAVRRSSLCLKICGRFSRRRHPCSTLVNFAKFIVSVNSLQKI